MQQGPAHSGLAFPRIPNREAKFICEMWSVPLSNALFNQPAVWFCDNWFCVFLLGLGTRHLDNKQTFKKANILWMGYLFKKGNSCQALDYLYDQKAILPHCFIHQPFMMGHI